MLKLSFKKEIRADIEKSFKILSDFENFQKLFPQFYPSILIKSVLVITVFILTFHATPVDVMGVTLY